MKQPLHSTTDKQNIEAVYFIGIGGIGMSAIARYYMAQGLAVGGYDRIETELTRNLIEEGAQIHYCDDPTLITSQFKHPENCLVVYTPAIPPEHAELSFFRNLGFRVEKRAEVLGRLTRQKKGLCVAGTHGKTTTSTMTAHILHGSADGCNAFLGGISKNYGTNYLVAPKSEYVVVEADEYDRSFYHLSPYATVITAVDADHLDIYTDEADYRAAFTHYTSLIQCNGFLILHEGLDIKTACDETVRIYTYGRTSGDFHAEQIRIGDGRICFDLHSPLGDILNIELGVPISVNIENSIAAIALAQIAGINATQIRSAMLDFEGVCRRFDFKLRTPDAVVLTDYAHHPKEIQQSLVSLRELYKNQKIMAVFQPHLYSRTRDFYMDFARSLSVADEVILTDIYPAREKPIEGITSELIYNNLRGDIKKTMCHKQDIAEAVRKSMAQVVVLLGAGDIEAQAERVVEAVQKRKEI